MESKILLFFSLFILVLASTVSADTWTDATFTPSLSNVTYDFTGTSFTADRVVVGPYCFNVTFPTYSREYCQGSAAPTSTTPTFAKANVSNVYITPGSPSEFDVLAANYNLTYTDGYGDCSKFKWFKNNIVIAGQTNPTLAPASFAAYDEIIVQVTPNDCNGDGTPLNSTLVRVRKTVASGDEGGGGGGGGATPTTTIEIDDDKDACKIEIASKTVYLGSQSELVEVIVRNRDDISYNPSFKIWDIQGNTSKYISLTNALGTILPGKQNSFGLDYEPTDTLIPGKMIIMLTSENCKNLNITVYSKSVDREKTVIEELFSDDMTLIGFFQENLFRPGTDIRKTLPALSIGILSILIMMIVTGFLLKSIMLSFREGKVGTSIAWIVFVVFVTSIATVFTVVGIRTLQSFIPILM